MKRSLFALTVAAAPLAGLAQSNNSVIGMYRLQASDEMLALARLSGASAPKCTLQFTSDRRFTLRSESASGVQTRSGAFSLKGEKIILKSQEGELLATQNGSRLLLDGLSFLREQATPTASPSASFSMFGVWTPHKNGKEDRSIKMTLGKDGSFSFACWGAKSSGKWEIQGSKLVLLWTQVDDQKVELGSMRKEFPIASDGNSFDIDAYHYERS